MIRPVSFVKGTPSYDAWIFSCLAAEEAYFRILENDAPEMARSVLPLCTKADLVSTMNLREWRHFFLLRAADITGPAHPDMKRVTVPLLDDMKKFLPEVFGDIGSTGEKHDR